MSRVTSESETPIPQVAIAILHQEGQYLLQLRDPIPTIVYPGHWGLFGGHMELGETPETAIWRELAEEIGYVPPYLKFWSQETSAEVVRHIFYGPLTVAVETLDLKEGWDCGLLSPDQIRQGEMYSAIAQQTCPLGGPHRRILLSFLAQMASDLPPL